MHLPWGKDSVISRFISRLLAVAVIGFTCLPTFSWSAERYILATATTGGTYYPVGVALATLTKVKLEPGTGISLSAISSAGSAENVKLMSDNEAQFAILQGLYGAWAWNGTGAMKNVGPQKNLRAVTMLWQNVEHFAIFNHYVESGNMDDMKLMAGKKFSIGVRNSGTEGSGRFILEGLGYDPDKLLNLVYLGYGPSASAIQNNTIEGFNIPAGVPVGAVTQAYAALGENLHILDFTPEQIVRANQGLDLWTPYTIPANTYPSQIKPVNTMAQPNFLAVRSDIPEATVYAITKSIYENLPFLNGIHKATRDMALDKAIVGLPMPLHPGAARFFKEKGLRIPGKLITQN